MDWDGAPYAEYNLVIILVVANSADRTASIVLSDQRSLLQIHLLDFFLQLHAFAFILSALLNHVFHFVHLVQYEPVFHIISPLLGQFQFFQEIILELARIVDIQQEFVHVLTVPIFVLHYVLDKARVHVAEELLPVLPDVLRLVYCSISVARRVRFGFQSFLKLIFDLTEYFLQLSLIVGVQFLQVCLGYMYHFLEVLQMHRLLDLSNFLLRILIILNHIVDDVRSIFCVSYFDLVHLI